MALTPDLNADAGNLQFNAGLPLLFAPVFALVFPAFSRTLDRNSLSIPVSAFDTLLLANGPRTLLPTHAIGPGLGNQYCRGHHRGGDRKSIEYHPHKKILLNVVSLN
jgi:hypothetical protein